MGERKHSKGKHVEMMVETKEFGHSIFQADNSVGK